MDALGLSGGWFTPLYDDLWRHCGGATTLPSRALVFSSITFFMYSFDV